MLLLVIIGVALYCFNRWFPWCDAGVKKVINIFVIICCVLIVLNAFGVFAYLHDVAIPRVR